jgi:hypothetical protein
MMVGFAGFLGCLRVGRIEYGVTFGCVAASRLKAGCGQNWPPHVWGVGD